MVYFSAVTNKINSNLNKMSVRNKDDVYMMEVKPWYRQITVEPIMFLYMMAFMITNVTERSFYIFKACTVNHNYSAEICHNISAYKEINNEIQATTLTSFIQWNSIASHIVPLFLAFFLGSYSDKRGRKVILLAGLLGKLYFSIMITINAMNTWPLEYVIYTATFPSALTGADLAIFAGCFSYVADISSLKSRTLRIGVLDIAYLSTLPTGVAVGNLLWNTVAKNNYTMMFTINTSLMALATLYALLFIKWRTRPEQKSLREAGVTNPITDFFDLNNIVKTVTTLTKKRENNQRLFLWFLLISMAFYTFQRDEREVMFYYTTVVFGWNVTQFSNFRSFLSALYVLAMMFGIPIMTKVFNWRDTVILMVGASAHICGHLFYSHAETGTLMYVGAVAAALGPVIAPLIRSMTSKVLPANERGVAYTFLSVMENAVSMFASIIYSQIYRNTLDTSFVNAIFYFTIGTQVIVFLLVLSIEVMLRGRPIEEMMLEKSEAEDNISTN